MHVIIDHRTTYRYEQPASAVVQMLRVTPRADDSQQILSWRIDIDADGRLIPFTDVHGNRAHVFYADRPLEHLSIHVSGEVVTTDRAGILGELDEPLRPAIYARPTALTMACPALSALAASVNDANQVVRAHGLMMAVSEGMAFVPGVTTSLTDARTAFALGRGVCQDMAHCLIAAARAAGFPARYVSGHYAAPDHPEQEAAHAWAELWIEGLGWVSFDPANEMSASEGHIRVAVGFDALDASPVRGSRRGGGEEQMAVEVHGRERVTKVRPDFAARYQQQQQA